MNTTRDDLKAPRPTLHAAPKGVCLNRQKNQLCAWPRCNCRVDLVYMTDCRIPKPRRGES